MTPGLVWFRRDLRLDDNPALAAALARGGAVVPVFVHDEGADGAWAAGGASRGWLHHSLEAFDASLRERGSRLVVARGDSVAHLRRIAAQTGARAVYWNRSVEPSACALDRAAARALGGDGIEALQFNASLLFEPASVANRQGKPFQVFTPYWRHCCTLPVDPPVRCAAKSFPAPARWPKSLRLADLRLMRGSRWDAGVGGGWEPGERGAARRLRRFAKAPVDAYARRRDLPDLDGTSMLSAHLHFGEVGPRQVWAAVRARSRDSGAFPANLGARVFLSEIGWREFAHYLLFHFPKTPENPFRPGFAAFPWLADPGAARLHAWQQGITGYPIVDAGMRQLLRTGWMHNRVRMIAASFLVKHLLIPWNSGARWFWNTLVDADLANNTLGWQWSAGCGVDAAPFFRIFSPMLQGARFDPQGAYVRRWVPELSALPARHVHAPWEAPAAVLAAAGVRLGGTYPRPVVGHAFARAAALDAFRRMRTAPRS